MRVSFRLLLLAMAVVSVTDRAVAGVVADRLDGVSEVVPRSFQEQASFVAGIVLDARTLAPIPGAQVTIEGTGLGMVTTNAGRFRIQNVTGQEVTLHVVMLGYRSVTQVARVGDPDVRILMEQSAVELDEIVVTGVPGWRDPVFSTSRYGSAGLRLISLSSMRGRLKAGAPQGAEATLATAQEAAYSAGVW